VVVAQVVVIRGATHLAVLVAVEAQPMFVEPSMQKV